MQEDIEYVREYIAKTADYWDSDDDMKVGKRLLAMSGRLKGYDTRLDAALARLNMAENLAGSRVEDTGPRRAV